MKNKTIKGFSLLNTKHAFNPFSNPEALKKLHELLKTLLSTQYVNEYPLSEINEAFNTYKSNSTAGKVLIRPQLWVLKIYIHVIIKSIYYKFYVYKNVKIWFENSNSKNKIQ